MKISKGQRPRTLRRGVEHQRFFDCCALPDTVSGHCCTHAWCSPGAPLTCPLCAAMSSELSASLVLVGPRKNRDGLRTGYYY